MSSLLFHTILRSRRRVCVLVLRTRGTTNNWAGMQNNDVSHGFACEATQTNSYCNTYAGYGVAATLMTESTTLYARLCQASQFQSAAEGRDKHINNSTQTTRLETISLARLKLLFSRPRSCRLVGETHDRCYTWMSSHHLGWFVRIPGEWPRTIGLIFGVVCQLVILGVLFAMRVLFCCGWGSPEEIRACLVLVSVACFVEEECLLVCEKVHPRVFLLARVRVLFALSILEMQSLLCTLNKQKGNTLARGSLRQQGCGLQGDPWMHYRSME